MQFMKILQKSMNMTTTIRKLSNNAHLKPNKMIIMNNNLANMKRVHCIVNCIRNWNQCIAYFIKMLSEWLLLL